MLRRARIVILRSLRQKCVQLAHEGHLGIVGTKQRLRTKVSWLTSDKDAEILLKKCHRCQITSALSKPEPIKPTSLPTWPWQDLAIDVLGPLTSGQYLFLVVDNFSRYYEIEITKYITWENY